MKLCIRYSIVLAAGVLLGSATTANADESAECLARAAAASDALLSQLEGHIPLESQVDCAKVWEVYWTSAKEGTHFALLLMHNLMGYPIALRPPGAVDGEALVEAYDKIVIYSVRDTMPECADTLMGDLRYIASLEDWAMRGAGTFMQCIEGRRDPSCLDEAIASGMIEPFDEFAGTIDSWAGPGDTGECGMNFEVDHF